MEIYTHGMDGRNFLIQPNSNKTDKPVDKPVDKTFSPDTNIILGIFLLIIAVSGNFVAETLSCQFQRLLSENMIAKNLIVLMIIYFSLGFASSQELTHPVFLMMQSVTIWVFFLLFNKMDMAFTIIVLIGLFMILVMKNFADYYRKIEGGGSEVASILSGAMNNAFAFICLVVIMGFLLYLKKQYTEYQRSFSFVTFLLGNTKCSSMM